VLQPSRAERRDLTATERKSVDDNVAEVRRLQAEEERAANSRANIDEIG
jgi:hypothetical protein